MAGCSSSLSLCENAPKFIATRDVGWFCAYSLGAGKRKNACMNCITSEHAEQRKFENANEFATAIEKELNGRRTDPNGIYFNQFSTVDCCVEFQSKVESLSMDISSACVLSRTIVDCQSIKNLFN